MGRVEKRSSRARRIEQVKAGDRFNITLLFAKAKPKRVDISVRSASEGMAH